MIKKYIITVVCTILFISLRAQVYDIINASDKEQYRETELFKSNMKQIQDRTKSEIAAINVQIEELKQLERNDSDTIMH